MQDPWTSPHSQTPQDPPPTPPSLPRQRPSLDARPFVHESIIGTTFSARVVERTTVGDHAAIVPELTGEAWITGEHTFIVQSGDPLKKGFRL